MDTNLIVQHTVVLCFHQRRIKLPTKSLRRYVAENSSYGFKHGFELHFNLLSPWKINEKFSRAGRTEAQEGFLENYVSVL